MMNDQVKLLVESLQNQDEPAITIQVNREGRVLIDYKIPEGAGVNENDLAFMAANLVIAAKRVVGDVRNDILENETVSPEMFDKIMAEYLTPPEEGDADPLSR